MKALVLGGGSLKGAWQAGAVQAVLESGFSPDMIYGISAGALNASFLANEASVQFEKHNFVNWPESNKNLLAFWMKNITCPEDIGIPKSYWTLGMGTMFSRFDGLLDVNTLHEKIRKEISIKQLQRSPVRLKVGAVNIHSGKIKYVSPFNEHFLDFLRASSSLPIVMPTVQIGTDNHEVYLDGGIREMIPVRQAIEDGATEIYAIATHPKHSSLEPINHRSLLQIIDRIKDISVNQLENNDIAWAQTYNEDLMSAYGYSINKKIKFTIIRPDNSVRIKLNKFNLEDIKNIIKLGYITATEVIYTN